MTKFLFQRNLWALDLIVSICFVFSISYLFNADSDLGNPYSKTHWTVIFYSVLLHLIIFAVAFNLQRPKWMKSWFWLGIIGTLVNIIFTTVIHFPKLWEYAQVGSATLAEAKSKMIYNVLTAIAIGWFAWGIIDLIFIFTVRFLAYLFLKFIRPTLSIKQVILENS